MNLDGYQERALELLTRSNVTGEDRLRDATALARAVDIFDRLYRRTDGGDVAPLEAIRSYLEAAGWSRDQAQEVRRVWQVVNLVNDFHTDNALRPFRHLNLSPKR